METAISIETNLWNKLLRQLVAEHWRVKFKYDNFDAGIDFDLVILEKDQEEILFGWDNWFEGEIQCSKQKMKDIERMANQEFKKGKPENLKPEIIKLYRKS